MGLEGIKRFFNTPITTEKRGRGEVIIYHAYRIFKSGKIEDCYGNPITPKMRDGVAYIPVDTGVEGSNQVVEVEVGRIVYHSLISQIDLLGDNPRIIYKDGNGANFRPENLAIEETTREIDLSDKTIEIELPERKKQVINVEEVLAEATSAPTDDPVEILQEYVNEMTEIVEEENSKNAEELINEVNSKAVGLINNNFAQEINSRIDALKAKIQELENLRRTDRVAYEKQLQELNVQIDQLRVLLGTKESQINTLTAQNNNLIAERENISKGYVILPKDKFFKMYNTMNRVLDMVNEVRRHQ